MRLYYSVFTNPAKRQKIAHEEPMIIETDSANNSDLKTEVSGYFTDEEKHNSETSMTQDTDESKTDSVLDGDGLDIDNVDNSPVEREADTSDHSLTKDNDTDIKKESADPVKYDADKVIVSSNTTKHNVDDIIKDDESPDLPSSPSDVDDNDISDSESSGKSSEVEMTNIGDDDKAKLVQSSEVKAGNESRKVDEVTETDTKVTEISEKRAKVDTQTETCQMVEASTDTIPGTSDDVQTGVRPSVVRKTKLCITDEDVSEPVVSSTQNTQGCQTEPPDYISDTLDIPHSSDSESISAVSPSHKSTVDVSCETDNFVVHRHKTKGHVSVSTATDDVNHVIKRKSVDCSTDVYDFPESDVDVEKKRKTECSTNFSDFPLDANKRRTLSIDCSTDIDDVYMPTSSSKRKQIDSDNNQNDTKTKKVDVKIPKRSFSYSGHLSTPKAAYLAQPLSPTKLTLKFTQPKSPVKTCPKSPSRSETTGFQSQYQSFVMDLPEKTYVFEDDEPQPSKPLKHSASLKATTPPYSLSQSQSLPESHKKSLSKTGRPRGRPPKNKTMEPVTVKLKEKKHKSRSHSPKHKKSDKDRDRSSESSCEKSSKSANSDKKSNAYSWINKIDTKVSPSSEQKPKNKHEDQSSSDTPPSDLRIPKQFLYYSNGQYTLATVSSLNTLKQSSPVSPPPRTVFTSEINKKDKTISHTKSDAGHKKIPTSTKPACSETEPKEIKAIDTDVKTQVINEPKKQLVVNKVKLNETKADEVTVSKVFKPQHVPKTQTTVQTDVSQSKSPNMRPVPLPKTPKSSSSTLPTPSVNTLTTKEKPMTSTPKDKSAVTTSAPLPEYRHQSPFFASMSGVKLSTPHRPPTHLNIPNLNSHFSGSHPIYAQGRYSSERLAAPLLRSFSMGDKTSGQSTAKLNEQRRMEAMAYMTHFGPGNYLGLMHSQLISSLPHHHLAQQGHYQESSKSIAYSELATNGASSMSQNVARPFEKTNSQTSIKGGKEKSIDKIINQITEKKKKETQEQVNGIDLSTKGSKKDESGVKVMNNERNGTKGENKKEVERVKLVNNGRIENHTNKCVEK